MNIMNMTKRRVGVLLFLVVGISCCFFYNPRSDKNKYSDEYSVKTFQSGDGWGYQISQKEKVIIMQPYMPCLIGENPFPDEKSARETGELVLSKIRDNQDPLITMEELEKIISI